MPTLSETASPSAQVPEIEAGLSSVADRRTVGVAGGAASTISSSLVLSVLVVPAASVVSTTIS